jgi:hypothetical protein
MDTRSAPFDRAKRLAERLILSPLMWFAAVLAERVLLRMVAQPAKGGRPRDEQSRSE